MNHQSIKSLDALPDWDDNQILEEAWKRRMQSGLAFKNCYLGLGGIYQVKLFIGGEQRTLGESRIGVRAARFADMAISHFLQYRKRRCRPLVDADLNFSVEQAKRDAANLPSAVAILKNWEARLIKASLITPAPMPTADRDQVRKFLLLHFQQTGVYYECARQVLSGDPKAQEMMKQMDTYRDNWTVCIRTVDAALCRHVESSLADIMDSDVTPAAAAAVAEVPDTDNSENQML